jgi:hypothetical protein
MSLIHAFGTRPARTVVRHEVHAGERAAQLDGAVAAGRAADHEGCLVTIQELREENEMLRRSANEFAALAERLQRALVRERGRTARQDASDSAGDRLAGNHVLAISTQIEEEFKAIPNLRLTRWQAARLWDLEQGECDEAIATLVRRRVLRETPAGFMRREK